MRNWDGFLTHMLTIWLAVLKINDSRSICKFPLLWFDIVCSQFDTVIRYWLDSDLLIRYCLIRISWFGTNSIRYGWFGICICNHYLLTLRWNSWRHRCAQSTNLLTPIEILIHRAQWSCSCYTSLVFSPGCSLLECRDAWCVLRALLLGGSKMQGCQPIYANDYFTTHTVSSSLVLNLSLMSQMN